MTRVFRSVPELMVLIHGMALAVRSVCTTLILLVLITYTFAIVFRSLLDEDSQSALAGDDGPNNFSSVPVSINFLILQVLCGFDGTYITKLLDVSSMCYVVMLVYLLLASLTLMNMLIGVLVEVVAQTAELERDDLALKELKRKIHDVVKYVNEDGDSTVTQEEFTKMIENDEAVQTLFEGGVNVFALVDFADFIFRDHAEMSLHDFTQLILQFRGSNAVTVKDVVDLRVFMSKELARQSHLYNHHMPPSSQFMPVMPLTT